MGCIRNGRMPVHLDFFHYNRCEAELGHNTAELVHSTLGAVEIIEGDNHPPRIPEAIERKANSPFCILPYFIRGTFLGTNLKWNHLSPKLLLCAVATRPELRAETVRDIEFTAIQALCAIPRLQPQTLRQFQIRRYGHTVREETAHCWPKPSRLVCAVLALWLSYLREKVSKSSYVTSQSLDDRPLRGLCLSQTRDGSKRMCKSDLDRVFDPFFRLEFSRDSHLGGVGLGLAIVKSRIEACAGSIVCRNRSQGGLEVEMALKPAV